MHLLVVNILQMHRTAPYNKNYLAEHAKSAQAEKFCSKARVFSPACPLEMGMLGLQPGSIRTEPLSWDPGISIFRISPDDSNVKPALRTSRLEPPFWEKFPKMDWHIAPNHLGQSMLQTLGPTARPGGPGHLRKSDCCPPGVSLSAEGPAEPSSPPFPLCPSLREEGCWWRRGGVGEHSWDSNHLQPQKSISSISFSSPPSKLSCREKHPLSESNPEAPS